MLKIIKVIWQRIKLKGVQMWLKGLISLICLVFILLHMFCPKITIDNITIIALILGFIPWLSDLFKEIEMPGGWKIKFNDQKRLEKQFSDTGLDVELTDKDENKYSFQYIGKTDMNLALAGLRIEIEKKLREIAEKKNISTEMQGIGRLIGILYEKKLIEFEEKSLISDMIGMLNGAVHGKNIDEESFDWAMDYGVRILLSLEKRT